jgi:hypothetical protein
MLVSLGAFISPLTFPTAPLTLEDLKVPPRCVLKWVYGKIDVYLKGLLIICVCFVLLKIPGIRYVGNLYTQGAFGVLEGRAGSHLFEEITKAGLAALVIMYVVRLGIVLGHGFIFAIVWVSSISFLWISLQYEANEVLHVIPFATSGITVVGAKLGVDFLNDVCEVLIDATKDQEKHDPPEFIPLE